MTTRKSVWIFITCVLIIFIICLSRSHKSKETDSVVKLFVSNNEKKTMVLNKHLQLFLQGRNASVVKSREIFNHYLNQDQVDKIFNCLKMAKDDITTGIKEFNRGDYFHVHHHSYLKVNNSILIEIGGGYGIDAALFTAVFNPRHLIAEMMPTFANILKEKFNKNPRVTVLNFGLGLRTETISIESKDESSNIYSNNFEHAKINVSIINSTEFFQHLGVGKYMVDLLSLDCKACELDILENLLESGMVKYFKNIQFVVHSRGNFLNQEEYIARYCTLQELMQRTHRLTYQYKHGWENWRLVNL